MRNHMIAAEAYMLERAEIRRRREPNLGAV
jgi:hypothetical protein